MVYCGYNALCFQIRTRWLPGPERGSNDVVRHFKPGAFGFSFPQMFQFRRFRRVVVVVIGVRHPHVFFAAASCPCGAALAPMSSVQNTTVRCSHPTSPVSLPRSRARWCVFAVCRLLNALLARGCRKWLPGPDTLTGEVVTW